MHICLDGRMNAEASVVALGMFDGVHIGHQVLLRKAKSIADSLNLPMVVQTFSQHPLCLLAPHKCPPMLTTLNERVRLMEAQGVDILCAPPFTEAMRDMLSEEFIGRLVRQWRPRAIVVGYNYSFGSHGAGTPALLHALGDALSFETYVVPEIRLDGEAVSATRIRTLLTQGCIAQARRLLGRPYLMQVELINRAGRRCEMASVDNGKQKLGEGQYRALLGCERREIAVLVTVDGQGSMVCAVPESAELGDELCLRFVSEVVR